MILCAEDFYARRAEEEKGAEGLFDLCGVVIEYAAATERELSAMTQAACDLMAVLEDLDDTAISGAQRLTICSANLVVIARVKAMLG